MEHGLPRTQIDSECAQVQFRVSQYRQVLCSIFVTLLSLIVALVDC
jgi:hypothetical protein